MTTERRETILRYLAQKDFITVKDMAELIHVSEPTVRRDFAELEKEGVIRRNHGGASYLSEGEYEWPFTFRNRSNIDKKTYIAGLATSYIENGDTIFLDSSSTCYCMAKELVKFDSLKVLSQGLPSMHALANNEGITIECLCGTYNVKRDAIYGSDAINFINQRHAKYCIISTSTLNLGYGMMDNAEEEIGMKQAFVKNADKVMLLIDSTKFGKTSYYRTVPFEDIDIIVCDQRLPEEMCKYCDEHGIEYVY